MNFSQLDQTYNFTDNSTNKVYNFRDFEVGAKNKQLYHYNLPKKGQNSKKPNEKAVMATKGTFGENDIDPVTDLFFSNENVKRIQRMIKQEVYNRTRGKYKLEQDQAEADLLVSMKAVLFDENVGSSFLPTKIKRQVKKLNIGVVQYIVPEMISNIEQYYGYLKDINKPIEPMLRPTNVNNAGRKTLPSITTVWGL